MTGCVPGLVVKGFGRSGWLRPPYYIMVQFLTGTNGSLGIWRAIGEREKKRGKETRNGENGISNCQICVLHPPKLKAINPMKTKTILLALPMFCALSALLSLLLPIPNLAAQNPTSVGGTTEAYNVEVVSLLNQAKLLLSRGSGNYQGKRAAALGQIDYALAEYHAPRTNYPWHPSGQNASTEYLRQSLAKLEDAVVKVSGEGPVHQHISKAINLVKACLKEDGV